MVSIHLSRRVSRWKVLDSLFTTQISVVLHPVLFPLLSFLLLSSFHSKLHQSVFNGKRKWRKLFSPTFCPFQTSRFRQLFFLLLLLLWKCFRGKVEKANKKKKERKDCSYGKEIPYLHKARRELSNFTGWEADESANHHYEAGIFLIKDKKPS